MVVYQLPYGLALVDDVTIYDECQYSDVISAAFVVKWHRKPYTSRPGAKYFEKYSNTLQLL